MASNRASCPCFPLRIRCMSGPGRRLSFHSLLVPERYLRPPCGTSVLYTYLLARQHEIALPTGQDRSKSLFVLLYIIVHHWALFHRRSCLYTFRRVRRSRSTWMPPQRRYPEEQETRT